MQRNGGALPTVQAMSVKGCKSADNAKFALLSETT